MKKKYILLLLLTLITNNFLLNSPNFKNALFTNKDLKKLDKIGIFQAAYIDIAITKNNIIKFVRNNEYNIWEKSLKINKIIQFKKINTLSEAEASELNKILNLAILDFLKIIEEFIEIAKKFKGLVLELIQEYKIIKNIDSTYIETWINFDDSINQKDILLKDIDSFEKLHDLCTDIVFFLHIFLNSLETSKKNLTKNNG